MEWLKNREVVLEIEHVQIIRKRAKTTLGFCQGCKKTTDFISVTRAAELFSTTTADLFEFTQANACHYMIECGEEIFLCLPDLLDLMGKRMNKGKVKLLGE